MNDIAKIAKAALDEYEAAVVADMADFSSNSFTRMAQAMSVLEENERDWLRALLAENARLLKFIDYLQDQMDDHAITKALAAYEQAAKGEG